MGSGSQRLLARFRYPLLATMVILGLSSCIPTNADFASRLRQLDEALVSQPPNRRLVAEAFVACYPLARVLTQWLSLAKRAGVSETLGDEGRRVITADRALKAFPSSEVIREVAAWLYLRGGNFQKARSVFSATMVGEDNKGLWAEATLRIFSASSEGNGQLDQKDFARLGEMTGDTSWYIDSALLAMKEGDRFAAGGWLRSALRAGSIPPYELLWDADLPKELFKLIGPRPELRLLPLGGDVAWLSGDRKAAASYWRKALRMNPDLSWKLVADLAALEPPGEAALVAAGELKRRFPDESEAQRFAAALFIRDGRTEEAISMIPSLKKGRAVLPQFLALELEAGKGSEIRLAAEVMRFAETNSLDAATGSGVMRVLLGRGLYEDFLTLHDQGPASGVKYYDTWFYDMMEAILRGERATARERAANNGAALVHAESSPGAFAVFAQGLTLSFEGGHSEARGKFLMALDLATTPRERSTILKELGRVELSLGDAKKAGAAWGAAAEADPRDAEALLLSTQKH